MIAVRLLGRAELEKRLSPYRCRFVANLDRGVELWETGWEEPFTLFPTNGVYDEWQYFQLIGTLIAQTMPDDWNDGD
jgi:hypothetical protein